MQSFSALKSMLALRGFNASCSKQAIANFRLCASTSQVDSTAYLPLASTLTIQQVFAMQRPFSHRPDARPNRSLNLTRYGKQRKPGPRPFGHHRGPGLRCSPPRAG